MQRFHSALVLVACLSGLTSCTDTTTVSDALAARTLQVSPTPLTADEVSDLLHMREEEKLARDVYSALGKTWSLRTFSNIAGSEQTHMDQVATLLTRYGVADPVAGLAAGQFATEHFQTLYTDLIAKGDQSLADALEVGAVIEEIDIVDLFDCKAATTHQDIARVYTNLEAASENHLRAFVGQLAGRGVAYVPQYLTQEQYDGIINP